MPLYSIRSERQLVQHIEYNLLYRWFVGLAYGRRGLGPLQLHPEPGPAAQRSGRCSFFGNVLDQAEWQGLVSSEHFTVDGTLIEAWASL